MKKKRFLKLLLNRLYFAKKLTWIIILVSIALQWYISSPIWAMLAEVQPSTGGSSGRTNQAIKLQKTQVHHDPRAKTANERVTEVQGKNNGEFNYYTECVSGEDKRM